MKLQLMGILVEYISETDQKCKMNEREKEREKGNLANNLKIHLIPEKNPVSDIFLKRRGYFFFYQRKCFYKKMLFFNRWLCNGERLDSY